MLYKKTSKKDLSIYLYVLDKVSIYGNSCIVGSVLHNRLTANDADIRIDTYFRSKKFLAEKLKEVITFYEYELVDHLRKLPLHFMVAGDFEQEIIVIKESKRQHLIHFIPKKWILLIWAGIKLRKLKLSLLKKF